MRKYCICGQKLTVAKEDGMFDGKGSIYCPACGLIQRKKPKQSLKPKEMENK